MSKQTRHSGVSVALALVFGLAVGALGSWSLSAQNRPAALPPGALASNTNVMSSAYEPVDGKGAEEVSGPYQVVKGWPQPVTEGWTINAETMYAESPDRIIAVGRGTHKSPWTTFWGPAAFRNLGKPIPPAEQEQQRMIVVYNRQGKVVESWDQWSPLLVDVQLIEENPFDPPHHITCTATAFTASSSIRTATGCTSSIASIPASRFSI